MKTAFSFGLLLGALLLATGCGGNPSVKSVNAGAPTGNPTTATQVQTNVPSLESLDTSNTKLIVTRDASVTGTVKFVNAKAEFVVVQFPIGYLPAQNQRLKLYRRGLKVGEVKINGFQNDNSITADVIAGNAQLGDEVR